MRRSVSAERLRHRVRALWVDRRVVVEETIATVVIGLIAVLVGLLPVALGLGAAWLVKHYFGR